MVTRTQKAVIATQLPGAARAAQDGATRVDPHVAATRAMRDALADVIASCDRYATAYADARRAPIGCDGRLGPILLDVLHGVAALGVDRELDDHVSEIISLHALDLDE